MFSVFLDHIRVLIMAIYLLFLNAIFFIILMRIFLFKQQHHMQVEIFKWRPWLGMIQFKDQRTN